MPCVKTHTNRHISILWGRLPVEVSTAKMDDFEVPVVSPRSRKTTVLMDLGAAIRRIRKQGGRSQEEVALLAQIDRSYMGAIERGEQNIGVLHLVQIAKALDTTVEALAGEAKL